MNGIAMAFQKVAEHSESEWQRLQGLRTRARILTPNEREDEKLLSRQQAYLDMKSWALSMARLLKQDGEAIDPCLEEVAERDDQS